jgi:hypothetical protein
MRKSAVVLVSTLFTFSLLTLATQGAFADEPIAAAPATAPPPPACAVLVPFDEAPPLKQYAITAYLLSATIGRYSIQGEYLPATHHAITLNPFYTNVGITTDNVGSLTGFGGELGYRFYTGRKGPDGFFVGPSVLFGSYLQSITGLPSTSFTNVGGAIDIGGQGVLRHGVVVGGGFGLQWTKTSKDVDTNNYRFSSAAIAGGGIRLRFLFAIGYAF